MTLFSAVSFIETKRFDQRPHSYSELQEWIQRFCRGEIPDYQMSAWLMAVCWRGMTLEETGFLTKCMVESGHQLEWPVTLKLVDKHSTGGVGDKISLLLAPLVACTGRHQVPMMAGRGLGHTGGTLDKLESIPGFRVSLTLPEFQATVQRVGCAIVSTTPELVVADRRLYALRDVTGTVAAIPLQVSSILSKKIAEHPHELVLDVKYGRGSFQRTWEEAVALATSLLATAHANDLPTTALLTRMDVPIGRAIGNWLEVKECLDYLRGKPNVCKDLQHLVLCEAAQMVSQQSDWDAVISQMEHLLASGVVYDKFRAMVQAQGGSVEVLDDYESFSSPHVQQCSIHAPCHGYVSDMNAFVMGQVSVSLGAGRESSNDSVDAWAGLWLHRVVGEPVSCGDLVVTLYASTKSKHVLEDCRRRLVESAISYSETPPTMVPIISHVMTREGGLQEFVMPSRLVAS
jgi:pyrimidine-nucleoside phosphorylase